MSLLISSFVYELPVWGLGYECERSPKADTTKRSLKHSLKKVYVVPALDYLQEMEMIPIVSYCCTI